MNEQPSSSSDHYLGILGEFNNNPMAVAGADTINVEYFDWSGTQQWVAERDSFPGNYLQWSSTVTFINKLYIFGGYAYPQTVSRTWRFDGSWEQMDDLLEPRRGHSSVVMGNQVVHVGGYKRL